MIAYSSLSMSKSELRYKTTRKELLAIINGLKQFCQYLTGRHFIIRTDHAALSWLRRTPEPMPQLTRWLIFIEEFDYEIVHRNGKRHSNCDVLSRRAEQLSTSNERATKSEQSELEEQIPSMKPVHVPDNEQAET